MMHTLKNLNQKIKKEVKEEMPQDKVFAQCKDRTEIIIKRTTKPHTNDKITSWKWFAK